MSLHYMVNIEKTSLKQNTINKSVLIKRLSMLVVWLANALLIVISFLFVAPSAIAAISSNVDIVGGNLVDHTTGLEWQSLTATAGMPFPASAQLGEWRVATTEEVFNLLPATGGEVAYSSTIFQPDVNKILSFFSASNPSDLDCGLFSPLEFSHCFVGWVYDKHNSTEDALYYPFWLSYGQQGQQGRFSIKIVSTWTLADYSRSDFCENVDSGSACYAGLFTVRAVPIPASAWLFSSVIACFIGIRRKII